MKNIPEIRIKGFEGEWKESVLQENLADNLRTNTLARAFLSDNDGEVLNVHYGDVLIKYDSLLNAAKDDIPHIKGSKAKDYSDFIQDGDIIFADTAEDETAGKCVEVINVGNNNIVSGLHTIACRPKHTFGKGFLGYYINSPKYHEQLYPLLQGIKVFSLNKSQLEQTEMRTPESLAEQQSLGSFFSSFDRLLSDHHRRLENLRRVKKSMLQKMFPQQGQTVPEIRFKGFSGEWEKVKLSDIANFSKGRGYSKNDLTTKGNGKPIILYGRMYTNYEFVINNVDTYARPLPNSVYSTGKEVIVPASGETAEDISIASAVIAKGIILGGDLNIILPYDDILYPPFLALYITNSNVHYELSLKAQGKTIVHLHNDALEDLEILVPPISEQQRLSSFFTSLDNLINDEVNYIDQLTRVKSTLLQKMFV